MKWHAVRCFECGTSYGKEFLRGFYHEYGSLEYCPRCGGDYLLGFKSEDTAMEIR